MRQYSDKERGAALAFLDFNGGNVRETARVLGVPHKTLDEWAKGRVNAESAEIRTEKKEDISTLIETAVREMVGASATKLSTANFQQLWTGVGIAVDKMQLLKGEPTNINKELLPSLERERMKDEIRRGLELVKKRA